MKRNIYLCLLVLCSSLFFLPQGHCSSFDTLSRSRGETFLIAQHDPPRSLRDGDDGPIGSIVINNNARYTTSTDVILNLSARHKPRGRRGAYSMEFSNDAVRWSRPERYAETKAWVLASGDGEKSVFVKFSDRSGNYSPAYSDTIILDTTQPSITDIEFSSEGNFHQGWPVTITVLANDPDGGVIEYRYIVDGVEIQAWTTLSQITWPPTADDIGLNTVEVEVRTVHGGFASRQEELYIFRQPVTP